MNAIDGEYFEKSSKSNHQWESSAAQEQGVALSLRTHTHTHNLDVTDRNQTSDELERM